MTNKLTEVQQCLVENHLRLVYLTINTHISRNRHNPHYDYDDLYQVGCMALCVAAIYYKPPTPFPAFAHLVIRQNLLKYCSKANEWGACFPIEAQEGHMIENIRDGSASPEECMEAQEVQEKLRMLRNHYSGVARKGIDAIELKQLGYSGADIAKLYGVRPNHVSAWVARARQHLVKDRDFIKSIA